MSAATDRTARYVEHVMGMPISLALRGRHAADDDARAAWQAVLDDLRAADRIFSSYRPDSAVSRLARGELHLDECPPEVGEVLDLAERARRGSGGAFSAYRPGPDGADVLDPSGVVKGWAVEQAAAALRALDDTAFCISAGGDVLCHTGAGESPWRIGVEDPHDTTRVLAVVPLRQGAVATSGTAHRGAHLVDARSGRAPAGIASVTVIARSLTWADIDATAAYALGPHAVEWLGHRLGRVGLIVHDDGTISHTGVPAPDLPPVRFSGPR